MATAVSLLNRTKIIATSGLSRVIASLGSVAVSFIIIRWQSSALWGSFLPYLLLLDFSFSIIAWGSTPFLIREFSSHPKNIKSEWSRSFVARLPLLIIFFGFIFFTPFPSIYKIALIVWACARYVYHSFEAIIQYERNFLFSLFTEITGLLIIVIPILLTPTEINTQNLVFLFSASMIWKALVSVIFFRSFLNFSSLDRNFHFQTFPFLLLTFSAMLQQRSDLYGAAYYLPQSDTARYQVFINLLIFCQFLASLLLSPFAKNIFRLSSSSYLKLEKRFMIYGVPLSGISLLSVYFIMIFLYQLEMNWLMYAMGYLYILQFYLYLLRNYQLGKTYQQIRVSVYSFIASAVNIALSILLIPIFKMEGAMLAAVLSQITLVVLYHQSFMFHAAR